MRAVLLIVRCLPLLLVLAGCDTPEQSAQRSARTAQREAILHEPPGDYFVGRRYYNSNYKFWGYVRQPGQPWREARLVMLNENRKLAPDREANQFGVDNNSEYRLHGHFTGETVYEPRSNRFLPEFLLMGYELVNRSPPSIFASGSDSGMDTTTVVQPE